MNDWPEQNDLSNAGDGVSSESGGASRGPGAMVLRWFLLLLLPATLAMGALAILGAAPANLLALAWAAAVLVGAAIALPPLFDLARLLGFLRDLTLERNPATPNTHTRPGTMAAFALARLRREQRRALSAAEAREQSHLAVFDALPDAVAILDAENRVVRANEAARGLFGPTLEGRDITGLVRNPPVLAAIDQAAAGGIRRELEIGLPLPMERRFIVSVMPLPAEAAAPAAILISFHDITAIRRSEQMRADFVANASHELRTPLSSLIGFIETLRGPARDDAPARERFLLIMNEQAERMARLIEDLLSLSRIEMNEHTPPSDAVDVGRVVASVVEALEPRARERRIALAVEAEPDLPPVRGEADEIAQVLQNLIENAIKYTTEDTEVTVAAAALEHGPATMPRESQGPVVAVAVRDRGPGIAQEHIPRLTERFYRVDSARSRKMGGTGLGLAIVKHIVSRHRGALTIDSTVGMGSVFTVYLPQVVARARTPETRPRAG